MVETLDGALASVRALLLSEGLVRAIAAGRRKGHTATWRRAEIRPVDLKAGRHVQVTCYDATQAHTTNHPYAIAMDALDALLAEPFGNWHVDTTTETLQVRITKKGEAMVHRTGREQPVAAATGHDRVKERLIAADDPLLVELGLSDAHGRPKASRDRKYRQVEQFLRALDHGIEDALRAGALRRPSAQEPLRIVDLGCGNGYLTFAAQRHLTQRGIPARLIGVDVKSQSREHNCAVAQRLGMADSMEFVEGAIAEVVIDPTPDVVLALHACDTATDDALGQAAHWAAGLVLAAPCCHHDVARQLRGSAPPAGYALMLRHGILRERLADTLTDALRAAALRGQGYRVEVVDFVESAHTPRNTLLRAVRTGAPRAEPDSDYAALTATWGISPAIGDRLR